jgi:hypothetical protein
MGRDASIEFLEELEQAKLSPQPAAERGYSAQLA